MMEATLPWIHASWPEAIPLNTFPSFNALDIVKHFWRYSFHWKVTSILKETNLPSQKNSWGLHWEELLLWHPPGEYIVTVMSEYEFSKSNSKGILDACNMFSLSVLCIKHPIFLILGSKTHFYQRKFCFLCMYFKIIVITTSMWMKSSSLA